MRTDSSKTAKTNGFFAGLVVFLISVAIGSFCTAIQIYACSSIVITSLLFWINFVLVGVRRGRCFAVFMMMLYSVALEIVLLVLIGFFAFYTLQPKYGPFCGNCKKDGVMDKECAKHCSVLGNIIMVSVFSAFSVINFFALLFLKNFRIYLKAHRPRRSGRHTARRHQTAVSVIPTPPPYYPTLPADSACLPPPPPYLECTLEDGVAACPPPYLEVVKTALPDTDTPGSSGS